MLNHNTEVTGPAIGVDVSGYVPLQGKPVMKNSVVGAGSYHAATFNSMLAALGMPSLERIIDDTFGNPDNYVTYVKAITSKGKNRTFKNKVSRKRILHKDRRLDEFRAMLNCPTSAFGGRW